MKKIYKLLLVQIFLLLSVAGFSQVTSTAPFSASYISVNQAGSVWAFGEGAKNGEGLYYSFNGWNFVEYNLSEGVLAASSTYGEIIIANGSGVVKEWNNNNKRWIPFIGISGVKDVFISKKDGNDKYALGKVKKADGTTKFGLWKVANISTKASDWQEILTDDGWAQQFIKATNDQYDNLYFVTSSGRLMARYTNSAEYSVIETQGRFVTDILVGEDNALYMMERGGGIYKQNGSGTWISARLSGTSFGVDASGGVYGVVGSEIQFVKDGSMSKITGENPNVLDANGNTPLTAAVVLNNLSAAQTALNNGSNVNMANRNADYPITLAVKLRNTAMVSLLVNSGADMTVRDREGHTPLYYAVQSSDRALTQTILLSKVDPNLEDVVTSAVLKKDNEMILLLGSYDTDLTPGLVKSAELNDTEMFNTLIQAGGKLSSNTAFNLATDRNNLDIAQSCLQNGVDKKEAVKYAVQKGNKAVIGVCLANGCPSDEVVDYVLRQSDTQLAEELITIHNVNANTVLAKAIPGVKSNSSEKSKPVNMPIATVALQNGAKPDSYFNYAVINKKTELVELLLLNGGDANKLLSESIAANNIEYATFAIDNGAKVGKVTNLTIKAVENEHTEMVKFLVSRGAVANDKRLIKAAVLKSNVELTKLFLENGAPTEDKSLIETAVTNNRADIAQELLNYGADPNTSIELAVTNNATKIVLMMLDAGAVATNAVLIRKASTNGNVEIVSALVQRGANPDEGVIASINAGKLNTFNFLMDNGADLMNIDYVVATVSRNQVTMFKRLIDAGAPVAYNNQNNENLLHLACKNGSYEISEVLIRKGVDVDQKNNEGKTPLALAVKAGRNNVNLASLLVDNGADVNAKDNKGKSILKLADGKKVKNYLKSKGATK